MYNWGRTTGDEAKNLSFHKIGVCKADLSLGTEIVDTNWSLFD